VRRWPPLAVLAAVLLALGAVIVSSLGGDGDSNGALPAVAKGAPIDYRLVYEVTTPDGTTTEEHIVHRPFGAEVVTRDSKGTVTSERWSALGELVTRSQGAKAVALDTAIATSASDSRPDLFVDPLTKVKRATPSGSGQVGGRPCTKSLEPDTVATQGGAETSGGQAGTLPVRVTRCSDAQGLVLEERWVSAGGTTLLTKRAVELQLGDKVPAIEIPKADPLPAAQGNGSVKKVARDAKIPFLETFHLATPKGFTFVGRYAVVPARLSQSGGQVPADPGIALYTDVWRRGPDVLLLDQGATKSGTPPFVARSKLGPLEVPGVGAADLAVDLRIAEVRFTRPDGGFARLAGTVDPKALVAIADTITVKATPR
jgi:hypothetical protein